MSIKKNLSKLSVVAVALSLSVSAFAGPTAIEVRPVVKPETRKGVEVKGDAAKRVEGNKAIDASGRKAGEGIDATTKGRSELDVKAQVGATVVPGAEKASSIKFNKIESATKAELPVAKAANSEKAELQQAIKLIKEVLGKDAVQNIAQGSKAANNADHGTDLVIGANRLAQRVKAGTLPLETASLMVREQADAFRDLGEAAYNSPMFKKACIEMEAPTLGRLSRLMNAEGGLEVRGPKYLENAMKEYGYETKEAACKGETVRGQKLNGKNPDGSDSGCPMTAVYGKAVGVACAR